MRTIRFLLAASLLAGCAIDKAPINDDFSGLTADDAKADAFSTHWKIVGSLDYGQTSGTVKHSGTPKYRAFKFGGSEGDQVDVWVRSPDGDAVAWVLDNNFKIVAKNDDADDSTLDSHIVTTLPKNASITHYVVFRDYGDNKASFTVELNGTKAFFACNVDDDCVAVPTVACCNDGSKTAVNKGEVDQYTSANQCTAVPRPLCPQHVINDTRVAECNNGTHQCEMIDPAQVHCGGFIRNAHQCSGGYHCDMTPPNADIGGQCVPNQACVQLILCMTYQHFDTTTCSCVNNQTCGGIGGIQCADPAMHCIDNPTDGCDPAHGGADCSGVCSL